ncbi:hypothetical protein R3P38DRAFT_3210471 [Favolaschia claudopus]|uniref:Uncharacterized protein n=1 Tax=Favolaschia claudopus TaxID=2862362 RepID=A0AAW0AJ26_9AGAR
MREVLRKRGPNEQGQIGAIRELANVYLKRWLALMSGSPSLSNTVFVSVLREVAGLLQQLRNVPLSRSGQRRLGALLFLLLHTVAAPKDYNCRDGAVAARPHRPPHAQRFIVCPLRALGYAYGLAVIVSTIPVRPPYVSYDALAVLDTVIAVLKREGDQDLRVAGTEVEVAWAALAALKASGPTFVRPSHSCLFSGGTHSRNRKDFGVGAAGRAHDGYNSGTLVTLDVARRIAALLSNALVFANHFVTPRRAQKNVNAARGVACLRPRVHQCFAALGFSGITGATQFQSCMSLFASPDEYAGAGSAVQAAIAVSSRTFMEIWARGDGYGGKEKDLLTWDLVEVAIDSLLASMHHPVEYYGEEPPPAATSVVNTAIESFVQLLPLQNLKATLEKNAGQKAAVSVDAAVAVVLALCQVMGSAQLGRAKETFGSTQDTLVDGDSVLHTASSESGGRLANLAGTNFITGQIDLSTSSSIR